jgi:hypothetical protein
MSLTRARPPTFQRRLRSVTLRQRLTRLWTWSVRSRRWWSSWCATCCSRVRSCRKSRETHVHRPADPWARSADRAACPPLLSSGPVLAAALAMASRWCGHPGADGDGPGHSGGPEPHQPGRRHGAPHLSHGRAASATRLRAHRALRGRCSSRALRVPWDDQTVGSCECARPQRVPGSAACAGLQPGLGAGRQRPCLRCRPRPQDSAILVETRDVEGDLRLVREGHHDGVAIHGVGAPGAGAHRVPVPPSTTGGLRPGSALPALHWSDASHTPWARNASRTHRGQDAASLGQPALRRAQSRCP